MSSDSWHKAKALFQAALDVAPAERDAFVASRCAGDDSLRANLALLLAMHADPSQFLHTPIAASADPFIGRMLGGFRIIGRIGAGGMGAVYEAEQQQPHRRAAVKVIRPGFATRATLLRLEYESEILARLQHPGIAHIYAAGSFAIDAAGVGAQPWFAMELIDGEPLHAHCRSRLRSTREKLDLLLHVCDAVQHAHQRGVIHRDLKPSNILVDATGQPKILDFGVARTIDPDAQAAATMQTAIGELVGTFSYMSPEQLSGDAAGVDARCDVYALGVIGYEMLAGTLPIGSRATAVTDIIRAIEQETPRPLGTLDASLRGDVETIFAKALEKDRDRRYQSAAEFAADIRRHLADEPILARPATTLYQLRKFARRNRALVGGTLATLIVLTGGVVVSLALAQRARVEASRSRYEADKATAINNFITNDFLMNLLASVNTRDANERVPVAQLVDAAASKIATTFASQPLGEAAVRNEVGTIYYNLSAFDKAAEQFQLAMDRWEVQLGPDHPDTLKAVNNLGQCLAHLRRAEEAEALYRRALDGRVRTLGEDDPYTLVTMNNLAEIYRATGRLDEAEALLRRALAAQRRVHGDSHKNTITTMANLGSLLVRRDKIDEALALHRQAHAASRDTLGAEHLTTLTAATRLAQTSLRAGALGEAEALLVDVVNACERTLGSTHGQSVTARRALARVYKSQEKRDAMRDQLERALDGARGARNLPSIVIREIEAELAAATQPTTRGDSGRP